MLGKTDEVVPLVFREEHYHGVPRAALVAEIISQHQLTAALQEQLADQKKEGETLAREQRADQETITGLRKRIDDLKTRLATAELENARLRGYVARVQEDDVVREELVTTGDSEGAQQMVPKRKPTAFEPPDHLTNHLREQTGAGIFSGESLARRGERPRHWVTY